MKKNLTQTFCALMCMSLSFIYAQNNTPCATDYFFNKHNPTKALKDASNGNYLSLVENATKTANKASNVTATQQLIPVVFHVLYNTANQNVSESDINAIITHMNTVFSGTNDQTAVSATSATVIDNPNLQFCLASKDPSGNAHTGILRVYTTKSSFNPMYGDNPKTESTSWNTAKYLNVYVADMGANIGGYVERLYTDVGWYEGWSDDSVVVNTAVLTGSIAYFTKMTLSHEVCHYLGLKHVFPQSAPGPSGGTCGDGDAFTDTPNSKSPGQADRACSVRNGCPGFTRQSENIMDYADCPSMFTVEQANYMATNIITKRPQLIASGQQLCAALSVADVVLNNNTVQIYPNPSSDTFSVKGLTEKANVSLYTTNGRLVFEKNHYEGTAIDISKLASGVYFFKVLTNTGELTKK